MTELQIEVKGLDKIQAAMARFPQQVQAFMGKAALQASSEVIRTRGLKSYPPATYRNNLNRGYPYYIRGRGTQTSAYHNMGNSERYGSNWEVVGVPYGVRIKNEVSYAPYLAGQRQVGWAADVGWRKLLDVAKEKSERIVRIFEAGVRDCLKAIGLEVK